MRWRSGWWFWPAWCRRCSSSASSTSRRIVRFASEDVGLADPRALRVAIDAKEAFELLGLPEGSLALAEAAVYCALAPKSNALYVAEVEAKRDVAEKPAEPVPAVIRNAVTRLMNEVGFPSMSRQGNGDFGSPRAWE